jgi:universal stress protein A
MLPVRTILFPTDFSRASGAAFDLACAVARDYGARLIVLHVGVPPTPMVPEGLLGMDMEAFETDLRTLLAEVAAPAEIDVERRLIVAGEPVTDILSVADEVNADLIVMGTHGRSGVSRVLLGSIAERVLHEANCPVLLVRERARGSRARLAGVAAGVSDQELH